MTAIEVVPVMYQLVARAWQREHVHFSQYLCPLFVITCGYDDRDEQTRAASVGVTAISHEKHMNTRPPEPAEPATPPSYEGLLHDQYGAETVARGRAEAQATLGLSDPRTALGPGAVAPLFALSDSNGATVSLAGLRQQGPTVLIFYRGGWCPFCNVYLRTFQLARPHLRALGAQVVLISPEQTTRGQALAARHALLFPVLSDVGNAVARQYGLVFQIPQELRAEYLADGVDLAERNGDPSWEVPMPATFVVATDGRIQYAFVSADYTQRAEPAEVLTTLRRLHTRR